MTSPGAPIHQLSPTEREVAQALVARFAQAWQDGSSPRIDDYLQQPVQRVALLVELVRVDLAQRHRAGEPAGQKRKKLTQIMAAASRRPRRKTLKKPVS